MYMGLRFYGEDVAVNLERQVIVNMDELLLHDGLKNSKKFPGRWTSVYEDREGEANDKFPYILFCAPQWHSLRIEASIGLG